jgi:thioredoxin reductase (NADPH)
MSDIHKTLILGTGPAGYTAAIYAARANMEPVVLAGQQPGGQLTITSDVENYPGFPEGIMGPEMMEKFKAQAERFGSKVIYEHADQVDLSQRPFTVRTTAGNEYKCATLIISTGATAKYLGLPNETALQGRGVSACATCDGFFFKNKVVYVVGGGDSACEEATFLTKFASEVHMIVRRDVLRASKIMAQRAMEHPKITVHWNTAITDVFDVEHGKVNGVEITDTVTGETRRADCDGLFLAIGHQPNTAIFKGQLDMDAVGYLITRPDRTATNVPGVFACGDCQDSFYRQAVTAAGTGCGSAIEAERWLEDHPLPA